MNPLTQVKRIQKLNSAEASLGISEEASWHTSYKDSAYVFVGGIPFDLSEGDLLAVFAQYGEIVDLNLVRDKGTGKSKGFAFLAYEDQRSTILAVDNLNGAKLLGRIIRVDHVSKYKKKEEEDEEEEKKRREARGVCHAFQRGECNRGDSCKFSHDEQRSANTGWGVRDNDARWGHDMFEESSKKSRRRDSIHGLEHHDKDGEVKSMPGEKQDASQMKGDYSCWKSCSSKVERDDHRHKISRRETDKHGKGEASKEDKWHSSKEDREMQASERQSRNQKAQVEGEGCKERRGSQKQSRRDS